MISTANTVKLCCRKGVAVVNNFANIGKSVMLQSIGLQKNYTEIVESTTDVIDYSNTECMNCKWNAIIHNFEPCSELHNTAVNACANCSKKTVTQQNVYKKIYHNEKNRYGYKPMLKTNAIKLLLLLHFQHPDRFGIIKNVDARSMSKLLCCDCKTFCNNMRILASYNYISFSRSDTYIYTICLNDYDSYYLPANKGGRGFFVMSKELLQQLLMINNLVSLRIHIRELIELDNLSIQTPFSAINKSYKDMKQSLPDYCKPCVIRDALNNHSNIFQITVKEASVRFEIDNQYNSKLQKDRCYNEYYAMFIDFMNDFNNIVPLINTNKPVNTGYNAFFNSDESDNHQIFHLLSFSTAQLEDLAHLSLQYSYEHVLDALAVVYQTYIMNERKIHNLGGLLQTIISSNSYINQLAA